MELPRATGAARHAKTIPPLPNPAPGYRERANGTLVGVGSYGYSWSSAVSGTHGVFLHFDSQHLNPGYTHSRGHGLQLRCLSE